uniref:Lysozyme n=1 Tax=Coridius chinensis TaxID=1028097 RepID=A0A5C0ZSZ7_CORCQ|nr:lysozyme [Coridius chinensis]
MWRIILLLVCVWMSGSQSEFTNSVIDISHYQTNVDFSKVKSDGIVAVIHKATQGTRYVDPVYSQRRTLAQNYGLLWGAYHFASAGNPIAQADHFLKTVGNIDGVLLVVDLEDNGGNNMTPDEAEQFVKRIREKTGRYPVVYGSPNYLKTFNKENLNKCSLWIAMYSSSPQPILPQFRKSWVLWQYTDGAEGGNPRSVAGIGTCDRDRYNGSVDQLENRWPNL